MQYSILSRDSSKPRCAHRPAPGLQPLLPNIPPSPSLLFGPQTWSKSESVFCQLWDDIVVGWQEQDRWTGEIGLPWRSEVTDIVSNGLMNIWCQIPIVAGPRLLGSKYGFFCGNGAQSAAGSVWSGAQIWLWWYGCGCRDTQHELGSDAARAGSRGDARVWALLEERGIWRLAPSKVVLFSNCAQLIIILTFVAAR